MVHGSTLTKKPQLIAVYDVRGPELAYVWQQRQLGAVQSTVALSIPWTEQVRSASPAGTTGSRTSRIRITPPGVIRGRVPQFSLGFFARTFVHRMGIRTRDI